MMQPTMIKDGTRFGKLSVIKRHFPSLDNHHVFYDCACDCGVYHTVMACNLTNGSTRSCGCWNAESKRIRALKMRQQKGDIPGKLKRCSRCKELKSIDSYMEQKGRADRLSHRCRLCSLKCVRLSRYKVSESDFDSYLREQLGVCAICNKPEVVKRSLCIDHSHKTGKVRGLLCSYCNVGLGNFKDSTELLRRATKYLDLFAQA